MFLGYVLGICLGYFLGCVLGDVSLVGDVFGRSLGAFKMNFNDRNVTSWKNMYVMILYSTMIMTRIDMITIIIIVFNPIDTRT